MPVPYRPALRRALQRAGVLALVSASVLTASAAAYADTDRPGSSPTAAAAGLTPDQLEAGLIAAKKAVGDADGVGTARAVDAFAQATGTSREVAAKIMSQVVGQQPSPGKGTQAKGSIFDQAGIQQFARLLGVSRAAAGRAADQLIRLAEDSGTGIDPTSSGFRDIATGLGVTPRQLSDAIRAMKMTHGKGEQPKQDSKPGPDGQIS